MKISIVTISYNQAEYLKRCIDSILSQDHDDIEYIVVDPGSTDGSREIIQSYGDRIIKVFEKDSGAADGLNKGFAHATGEILGFINSDDELLPGALRTISLAFKKNPRAGAISGCGYFIDATGERIKPIIPSKFTAKRYTLGSVTLFQQGTFFKRDDFVRVGGFNPNNKTCWDGELFLDMAISGTRFYTIPNNVAHFRIHASSITGSGRLNEPYARDSERLFSKVFKRSRSHSDKYLMLLARLCKFFLEPSWLFRRATRSL